MSMRLLLMLVLWLTNRPTASSCIMSQEDLSHYLQAPVGNLGNTLWFSSAVVVFCRFCAYLCFGVSIPFHSFVMGKRFQKTFYTRAVPPHPLPPPQHASEPPLITRNVPTLCVHSSPSSPSANCKPCVDPATTSTQSMSCYSLSHEDVSTTVGAHCRHLSILPSTPHLSLVG